MSSAVNGFVHAICKCSQKCLTQKVTRFGSLGPIPMIQPPFNSACVALQYEPGTKLQWCQSGDYRLSMTVAFILH